MSSKTSQKMAEILDQLNEETPQSLSQKIVQKKTFCYNFWRERNNRGLYVNLNNVVKVHSITAVTPENDQNFQ